MVAKNEEYSTEQYRGGHQLNIWAGFFEAGLR